MTQLLLTYSHEGESHPYLEADYDMDFWVFKSDRRKARLADPCRCLLALGIARNKKVVFAHVGSCHDAYVGFKDSQSPTGVTVRHFNLLANAARVRDAFDTKGSPTTQRLTLTAPSPGRTTAHRRATNKRNYQEVKDGKRVRKVRGKQQHSRLTRLGVPHRPRAKIYKGEVSLPLFEAA